MKRFLIFAITLTALLVLLTVSVFAEDAVAKVGETEYLTLQEAIDAAGYGDTVVLLKDLSFESTLANAGCGVFNVAADDKIVLDLNGKTIDVIDNSVGNFIVIYNYGELTVKNGSIIVTSTIDRDWNAQSTVLMNRGGVLVIESGEYIHNGGTAMAFALDNSGNSFGDAYATINGGTLTSTYRAIRMRMADTTLNGDPGNGEVFLTINGGYIHGDNAGVWGQITNSYAGQLGNLGITGGTISGDNAAIQMGTDGYDNIDVTISGDAEIIGILKGEGSDFAISGGTFTTEVDPEFFADGFILVKDSEGNYFVGVSLESAFTFLGYSIPEYNPGSIAAGFTVDRDIIALYCEQNKVESFDFGCAFGKDVIAEKNNRSFASYTSFQNFYTKIQNIDPANEKHINANLAMALYVNYGDGVLYVAEIDGSIMLVNANEVPTVTFSSMLNR